MKFRAATEIAILLIFLVSALAIILWISRIVPADDSDGMNAAMYAQQGDQLYEAGKAKLNAAAVKYWEAVKRDPNMGHARLRLASIYYDKGWNQEPLRELDEVERINPDYPGLHLLRGKIYDRMAEPDLKFQALQKAVEIQPDNSEAHYYLAITYQQRQMIQEAVREYEKAVESGSKPGDNELEAIMKSHLHLGRIFRTGSGEIIQKDDSRAEEEFRKALEIDPTSAEVISELRILYKQQAEYYRSQREYDKAIEKYEEILKIDAKSLDNVMIYTEIGNIYRDNEQYDKAIEAYEAARELDPMDLEVFRDLRYAEMLKNSSDAEESEY